MAVEPLLRVEHLCQYFGPVHAVDDVSFSVMPARITSSISEKTASVMSCAACRRSSSKGCLMRRRSVSRFPQGTSSALSASFDAAYSV